MILPATTSAVRRTVALCAASLVAACASAAVDAEDAGSEDAPILPGHPLEGRIIYRVMTDRFENGDPSNDRGDISGGRLDHGFDPRRTRFYHGGDLQGVRARLDYIAGIGADAVQLSPVFGALPVAGPPGAETASFHGEWLVDLTRIDPHLGTMADLRALTDAARDRGMVVYVDAVLNGTADLFAYEGCEGGCGYRNEAAFPYTTRGDAFGPPINAGFAGSGTPDYRALEDPEWAYRPVAPTNDPRAPAWLRAPTSYHQRGPAGPRGEALRSGDLPGQDDLFTENPAVAAGLIDAYARLITEGGVDGFRVRDADAIGPFFLSAFAEAMRRTGQLEGRDVVVWGETLVEDADALARFTHEGGLSLVEDAAFGAATAEAVAGGAPAALSDLFRVDPVYKGGADRARLLPTAVSSFEGGRLARAVRRAYPAADADEVLERTRLGAVLLMTARGTPVLYMGDEQGFGGSGAASAQDMMASAVPSYVEADLLGTDATAADANFDLDHPYYRFIAALSALRRREAALVRGDHVTRYAEDGPGLFVFSRVLGIGDVGEEIVIAINTADERRDTFIEVDPRSDGFEQLAGYCASGVAARASYPISVPPRGFVICKSGWSAAE